MIDSFSGKYKWLSNFYPCFVELDGTTYPSVEHAYQAAKTLDLEERAVFLLNGTTAAMAKKLGKAVTVRTDWDAVKISIMRNLIQQKFTQHVDLAIQLLDTQNEEIVEGNWWNDRFWGVCRGQGENHLGKLIMEIRTQLQQQLQP